MDSFLAHFFTLFSGVTLFVAIIPLLLKLSSALWRRWKHAAEVSIKVGNVSLNVRGDDPDSIARVLKELYKEPSDGRATSADSESN
jgi:hypothetical protein